MSLDRRSFIKSSAIATGALAAGVSPAIAGTADTRREITAGAGAGTAAPTPRTAPLKILILGGTGYIGPEQVKYALERGHTLTLFNRGRTNPGLFPEVEKLQGDRNAPDGLDALKGRAWDVVIDNPATKPQWVVDAVAMLKDRVGQYVYVSSTGVYANSESASPDEDAPLLPPGPVSGPEADKAGFGEKKSRCESLVRAAFPGRSTVVRPGLIVGPGDLTDRFTYWPWRVEKGGEILAPGAFDDPVQWIDVRDLSQWMIRLAEQRVFGNFNAVGPSTPIGIGGMLWGIKGCFANDATFTWVPEPFLTEQKVRSWVEMPVWTYKGASTWAYCNSTMHRAVAAGLTLRPLAETVRDGMAWYHSRPAEQQEKLRAGITLEREHEVLAAWKARSGASRD